MRHEQPGSRFLALSLLTVPTGATPADANQVRPPLTNLGNAPAPLNQEFPRDLQKKMRQSPRNLNSEVKSFPPSYYLFNDKNMPLKK